MTTKFPPIKSPARRGIDPDAARALAESEGLGIPTTPDGPSSPSPAPRPSKALVADEVKPKRGAGLESFQADIPDDLMDELRLRALKEKTSVKALVLRALHDAGYTVPAEFLEDKRRRGR